MVPPRPAPIGCGSGGEGRRPPHWLRRAAGARVLPGVAGAGRGRGGGSGAPSRPQAAAPSGAGQSPARRGRRDDGVQAGGGGRRRRGQERADDPAHPEPLRGRVRPHHRGLVPEAGGHRRGDLPAGHPGHGRAGGVQRHARPVHAHRRGLPLRLRHQQRQVLRGRAPLQGADQPGEGLGRRPHGAGGQQVRPALAHRGHQAGAGAGAQLRHPLRGDLGQDQTGRGRRLLHAGAGDPEAQGEDQQRAQEEELPAEVRDPLRAAGAPAAPPPPAAPHRTAGRPRRGLGGVPGTHSPSAPGGSGPLAPRCRRARGRTRCRGSTDRCGEPGGRPPHRIAGARPRPGRPEPRGETPPRRVAATGRPERPRRSGSGAFVSLGPWAPAGTASASRRGPGINPGDAPPAPAVGSVSS